MKTLRKGRDSGGLKGTSDCPLNSSHFLRFCKACSLPAESGRLPSDDPGSSGVCGGTYPRLQTMSPVDRWAHRPESYN
jgi:hypothetical protein